VVVRIDYSVVVVGIEAIAAGATIRPVVAVAVVVAEQIAAAGHTVVVEGKLVAGVDIQPAHPRLSVDHVMSNKRVQWK